MGRYDVFMNCFVYLGLISGDSFFSRFFCRCAFHVLRLPPTPSVIYDPEPRPVLLSEERGRLCTPLFRFCVLRFVAAAQFVAFPAVVAWAFRLSVFGLSLFSSPLSKGRRHACLFVCLFRFPLFVEEFRERLKKRDIESGVCGTARMRRRYRRVGGRPREINSRAFSITADCQTALSFWCSVGRCLLRRVYPRVWCQVIVCRGSWLWIDLYDKAASWFWKRN